MRDKDIRRDMKFNDVIWNSMSPNKNVLKLHGDVAEATFTFMKFSDGIVVCLCSVTQNQGAKTFGVKPCNVDTEEEALIWMQDVLDALVVLFGFHFDLLTHTL